MRGQVLISPPRWIRNYHDPGVGRSSQILHCRKRNRPSDCWWDLVAHSEDKFLLFSYEYLQTFLIAAQQYTDFGLFTELGSGSTSPARWSWSWWYCKPLIGKWPESSDWPTRHDHGCAKAGPSSPPVHLSWIMNGVKIQPGSPLVTNMVPVYPLPDNRAISRSSIGVILTEESATR